METIAAVLDRKLRQWEPQIAEQVTQRVNEVMELADLGSLDLMRSRNVEQEVLDLLDESATR